MIILPWQPRPHCTVCRLLLFPIIKSLVQELLVRVVYGARPSVLGHQQEGRGEHYFSLTAPSSQAISNLMASSSVVNVSRCNAVEKSTEISSTDSASTCSEHFTSCNVTDLGTLFDGPARPLLHKYPKSTFGKQNRAFSATHYESYDFIE